MSHPYQDEIASLGRIEALPAMLEVVCRTTGMGFAAVAKVTVDRWIACQVRDEISFGMVPGQELVVSTTICDEIRDSKLPVAIDHVAIDPHYAKHHTPAMYGFQSYISMPIFLRDGAFFGTLCALDPHPRSVNSPEILGMFKLFAELVSFHMDAQERLDKSERELSRERQTAELREQFIAVLGHDLRNPLSSIKAGVGILRRGAGDKTPATLNLIERSIQRMSGLIDNVLDFARGRLGGGLSLNYADGQALRLALEHATAELRSAWPERIIESEFELGEFIGCDASHLAQMLSNLLANAITHGRPDRAIRVGASDRHGMLTLFVSNEGVPIAEKAIGSLFQPFFRESNQPSQQGLGLGLYIVSEIARAHGGALEVVSTETETRFTFTMPLHPASPLPLAGIANKPQS